MRSLFSSCVVALTALLAAAAPFFLLNPNAMAAPEGSRFNAEYFTNLPLVTHEGKTVRFYDDLIKDKLVVINFSYLTCNDICPLSTSRLAEVKRRLGDAVGRDVFIYTITMDPVNDTPEMLNIHAGAFEAGNGWLFLTGKPEDVERIRFQLGERSRKLTEHRNDLVMGNEKTGDWSRSSLFADIEVIVAGVRELDPVWRTAERKPQTDYAKAGNLRLSTTPGEALFLKACSTCHTIGRGALVGPDLKHVAARRDRDWLTRFMMAPGRMRAQKDPLTLELMAKFKGVRMPDLGLQETDVSDLLTYIGAQSHKQDTAGPRESAVTPPAAAPGG